jgi:hypothetical protein
MANRPSGWLLHTAAAIAGDHPPRMKETAASAIG